MGTAEQYLIERTWYGDAWLRWLLMPLTLLYALITATRRWLYRIGLLPVRKPDVPVVVVGNITVGGTGKTPLAIWLAKSMRHRGWNPGIVSRGYRGTLGASPVQVVEGSDPAVVGDEAILIAAESQCPVVVHPDRVAAAQMLVALGVDIIIADDGLQHYRMGRDMEIAVIDGARGLGNGSLLPSGPLREPASRLASVDVVLVQADEGAELPNGLPARNAARQFCLRPSAVSSVDGLTVRHLDDFSGITVCAIAGIGHPERFFGMLEKHGLDVVRRPLHDHAIIEQDDLLVDGDMPVLMTTKDAVKCRSLDTTNCWQVHVDVDFEEGAGEALMDQIVRAIGSGAGR